MPEFLLLVVFVAAYVLGAYPLMRIAKSTSDHWDDAWMAWVPIAGTILMFRLAKISAWWMLIFLIPYVSLIMLVVLWIRIGSRFHHTGLGWLAGLLPIIGSWVLAFNIESEPAY